MSVVMKLQERGQITLPKKLRDEMGLRQGDSVVAIPDGRGGYRLERLEHMKFEEIVQRWGRKEPSKVEDVERAIQAGEDAEADEFIRCFLEE
jgi:AbrB family looped-hinge helix DNA binding protein